jgi:hypothetical protein
VCCLSDVMSNRLPSLRAFLHVSLQIFHASTLGLGLPLSLNKLPKSQIQTIVDKMASMLSWWKVELMNRVCHDMHVQHVMTAKVIYTAMAMEFPSWACKAMTKF